MGTVRGVLLVILSLAVAALWVANCSGPRPTVSNVRLIAPRARGGAYQVGALVHNEGPGHGQVDITVRLRNTVTAQTIQQTTKVVLVSGETTFVSVTFQAPPATYTPEVEADYPPG